MESAILGLVLDSSILVAAERAGMTTPAAIKNIRASVGEVPIVLCALTVAELAHGIYRPRSPERARQRRQFLDELKTQLPVHPVTEVTAEIIARIGGAGSKPQLESTSRSATSSSAPVLWNSDMRWVRAMSATSAAFLG